MALLGHTAEVLPCLHTVGLVTSLTGAEADSVLGCVNWAGRAPSPDLLGRCAAVDEKAAVLFSQRDQALLSTTAVLLVLAHAHSPTPFMQLAMHLPLFLCICHVSVNMLCTEETGTEFLSVLLPCLR